MLISRPYLWLPRSPSPLLMAPPWDEEADRAIEYSQNISVSLPAVVAAAVTWDPLNLGTGITSISSDHLTVTGDGTSQANAKTTTRQTTGKFYFELTYTGSAVSTSTAQVYFESSLGTFPSNLTLANRVLGDSWKVQNVATAVNSTAVTVGDTMGVAVDFTANLAWAMCDSNPLWNEDAGAHPDTGAGGSSFGIMRTPTDTIVAAVSLNGNSGEICTLNVAGPFHFAASYTTLNAAGFGLWT